VTAVENKKNKEIIHHTHELFKQKYDRQVNLLYRSTFNLLLL